MNRFDYLRSAKPAIVRRLLDLRIGADLRAPLLATLGAIAIVTAAGCIEAKRLGTSVAIESEYRRDYEQSRLEVAKTKAFYTRVERLISLAKAVRTIQMSGEVEAARFAEIGNRLPPHVWLTSISNDDSGVALAGKAATLSALSTTISGLTRNRDGYSPTLVSVTGDDRAAKAGPLRYEVHLDRRPL